jgi:hypothetical protein
MRSWRGPTIGWKCEAVGVLPPVRDAAGSRICADRHGRHLGGTRMDIRRPLTLARAAATLMGSAIREE